MTIYFFPYITLFDFNCVGKRRGSMEDLIKILRDFGGGRGGKIGSNGRMMEIEENILGGGKIGDFLKHYYSNTNSTRGRVNKVN